VTDLNFSRCCLLALLFLLILQFSVALRVKPMYMALSIDVDIFSLRQLCIHPQLSYYRLALSSYTAFLSRSFPVAAPIVWSKLSVSTTELLVAYLSTFQPRLKTMVHLSLPHLGQVGRHLSVLTRHF